MMKQRQEPEPSQPPVPPRQAAVADVLRGRIDRGEYTPGMRLPSVRELAAEQGCSATDSHAAMRILAGEGLINIRDRRDAVVAPADRSIAGPNERMNRSRGGGLYRAGERQRILRPPYLAEGPREARVALGAAEGDLLGAREYVVYDASGRVVTCAVSYVPPDVWGQVDQVREDGPIPDGIIGAVRRAMGLETVFVLRDIEAACATEEEAALLGVPVGSPVLVEFAQCQLDDGTVVEWNRSAHPAGYKITG
jgi:GntR family transcriptional regulator